jgi:predicted DNA-binding transcriptional regulator AlpA
MRQLIKDTKDPRNISRKDEPDQPESKSKQPNAKVSTKKHQKQIQPKNLQHEDHSDLSTQSSGLPGGYMSEKKVIALIGMARSTINLMQDENSPYYASTFPKKRKLGTRRVAYKVSEVMQWIDSRDKVTPSARKKSPQ